MPGRTSIAVSSDSSAAVGRDVRLTRWLFRLHRWTGLICAIPMAIILISGTAAVFKDELDEFLNPHLLVVRPQPAVVPIDRAFRQVHSADRPVSFLYLPDEPHRPYLFYRRSADETSEQVTVDPYTGKVLGSRPANGHFADVLRQLHVRFYFFGATGRIVVGAFGLLLAFSGITGLILYPRFMRAQKWYEVRSWRGAQWLHSDLHKLLGITSLAVNLLLAITGAVLGLENLTAYYRPAQKYLHPSPSVRPPSGELRISLDQAVSAAASAMPGFVPRSLSIPSPLKSSPLVVYGNTGGNWTAPVSSWVALDPSTGAVLQVHDERAAHVVTRAYNLHDPLHFGYFGGAFTRWLWLIFGLAVSALPVTGAFLWWLKRRRCQRVSAT